MKRWKMNIAGRVGVLLISTGFAVFSALGVVSLLESYDATEGAVKSSRDMGEAVVSLVENVAVYQAEQLTWNGRFSGSRWMWWR